MFDVVLIVFDIKNEYIFGRLFKEMVTTKGKNGTGLGLFMSYSTIKANFHGKLEVDSIVGQGTTFSITLPAIKNLM